MLKQTFDRFPKAGEFRWVDQACMELISRNDAYLAGEWLVAAINVSGTAIDGHPQRRPPGVRKVDIRDLDTAFLGCEWVYESPNGIPGIEHTYGWWVLFSRRTSLSEEENKTIVYALETWLNDFWKHIGPQL